MNIKPENITKEVLALFPGVTAIYVFGSYAKGEATADSDLDIALLFPEL